MVKLDKCELIKMQFNKAQIRSNNYRVAVQDDGNEERAKWGGAQILFKIIQKETASKKLNEEHKKNTKVGLGKVENCVLFIRDKKLNRTRKYLIL